MYKLSAAVAYPSVDVECVFTIKLYTHSGPVTEFADVCITDSGKLLVGAFYPDLRALLTSLHPHPFPMKQYLLIPRLIKDF